MAYQVSDGTKKQTAKCLYDFECLVNDNCNTCTIDKEWIDQGEFYPAETYPAVKGFNR